MPSAKKSIKTQTWNITLRVTDTPASGRDKDFVPRKTLLKYLHEKLVSDKDWVTESDLDGVFIEEITAATIVK